MPAPTEVQAQDEVLNNIASYYHHEGTVNQHIAPIVDVKRITGRYYVFGREELRVMNDTLGRRSPANELEWHTTTAMYRTVARGLRTFIGTEDRENADPVIQLETTGTEKIIRALDLAAEVRCVAAVDAAIAATSATAAGTDWAAHGTTGLPLTDIATAKFNFKRACGRPPNAIVIPDQCVADMILCDEWTSQFTYDAGGAQKRIGTYSALPPLIDGMVPLVPSQLKLSGSPGVSDGLGPGGTPTLTSVWGDNVYLLWVNPRPAIMDASFMYTFATTRQRVRRYEDKAVGIGGGTYIQVEKQDTMKTVNVYMARQISNVI